MRDRNKSVKSRRRETCLRGRRVASRVQLT